MPRPGAETFGGGARGTVEGVTPREQGERDVDGIRGPSASLILLLVLLLLEDAGHPGRTRVTRVRRRTGR
ncbi:hypothetical protein GCM10022223_19810 [Kineosporia mesophila]|uniref:Uncharacterized protein n=1 Tax=Kineosporia mesophila TaxID=566012 RepID=A0ABP6ZBE7_9ACTN